MNAIIEHVRGTWPKPPQSNAERIEAWRKKYALAPMKAVPVTSAAQRGNQTKKETP